MKNIFKNAVLALLSAVAFTGCVEKEFEEITEVPLTRCLVPMDLDALINNGDEVTFMWTVTKEAATYTLSLSEDEGFSRAEEISVEAADVPYTVKLTADKTYYWRVQAHSGKLDDSKWAVAAEPVNTSAVRDGLNPQLTVRQKHTRECWVVAEDGADTARIEKEIKEMPNYFSDYDTTVHFISEEELLRDHRGLPHGGSVIYSGQTGDQKHVIEFSLKLDSNPEFTGSVLAAAARAAWRMNLDGQSGAKTMFDIAPKYLSPCSDEWLRAHYL